MALHLPKVCETAFRKFPSYIRYREGHQFIIYKKKDETDSTLNTAVQAIKAFVQDNSSFSQPFSLEEKKLSELIRANRYLLVNQNSIDFMNSEDGKDDVSQKESSSSTDTTSPTIKKDQQPKTPRITASFVFNIFNGVKKFLVDLATSPHPAAPTVFPLSGVPRLTPNDISGSCKLLNISPDQHNNVDLITQNYTQLLTTLKERKSKATPMVAQEFQYFIEDATLAYKTLTQKKDDLITSDKK